MTLTNVLIKIRMLQTIIILSIYFSILMMLFRQILFFPSSKSRWYCKKAIRTFGRRIKTQKLKRKFLPSLSLHGY